MFLNVPPEKIRAFCIRWKVSELAVFGSAIRDDFRSDSDVDVLVTFASSARWSLFDHVTMQDELSNLLGRSVDLVSKRGIEKSKNHIRRDEILATAQVIHNES